MPDVTFYSSNYCFFIYCQSFILAGLPLCTSNQELSRLTRKDTSGNHMTSTNDMVYFVYWLSTMNVINSDVTSTRDLRRILSNCNECQKITLNGRLIIPHSQLPNLDLKLLNRRNKYCVTTNTKLQGEGIGHWFSIFINKNTNQAFLLNGLTSMNLGRKVKANIRVFCKKNNLQLIDLSFSYQTQNSLKCGLLACYMVFKTHSVSVKKFLAFRQMMLNNSDKTNECYMIKQMKKHFKLS